MLRVSVNIQTIKDVFHFIAPTILFIVLPQCWATLFLVYSYVMLTGYIYFFVKKPEEVKVINIIGLLVNMIIIAGYVEAL